MLSDSQLYPAAGASAIVALIALVISGIALALFFGGAGAFWGPVNDLFLVVTVVALILPILAVDRLAAQHGVGWMRFVSVIAIVGVVVIAVGQTALVLGFLSLDGSYVTGTIGFIAVIVWLVALPVLAFASGALPTTVGWAAIAVLVLIVVEAVVAMVMMGPLVGVASVALLAALSVWLWTLSSTLLSRSVA
jgi:hypothetical protein